MFNAPIALSSLLISNISFNNASADSFLTRICTGFCNSTFRAYSLSLRCALLEKFLWIVSYSEGLTRNDIQDLCFFSLITIRFSLRYATWVHFFLLKCLLRNLLSYSRRLRRHGCKSQLCNN